MQQYHIENNIIHQTLKWCISLKILYILSKARRFKQPQQNNNNNIQPHQIPNLIFPSPINITKNNLITNNNKISKHKIDNENTFINAKVKWKP